MFFSPQLSALESPFSPPPPAPAADVREESAKPKLDLLSLLKQTPSGPSSSVSFKTPTVAKSDELYEPSPAPEQMIVQHVPVRQNTAEHMASLPSFLKPISTPAAIAQSTPKSILSPSSHGTPRVASRQVSVHFEDNILPGIGSVPSLEVLESNSTISTGVSADSLTTIESKVAAKETEAETTKKEVDDRLQSIIASIAHLQQDVANKMPSAVSSEQSPNKAFDGLAEKLQTMVPLYLYYSTC